MEVQSTEIRYFLDKKKRKIHIIDLNESGKKLLINEMSPQFQEELWEYLGLLEDYSLYDWYCYCHDGLILDYKDYNYKFLNPKLPYLYEPYIEIMKERRPK